MTDEEFDEYRREWLAANPGETPCSLNTLPQLLLPERPYRATIVDWAYVIFATLYIISTTVKALS